jgi:hypothetical protein
VALASDPVLVDLSGFGRLRIHTRQQFLRWLGRALHRGSEPSSGRWSPRWRSLMLSNRDLSKVAAGSPAWLTAGKYLASTAYHAIDPNPPKWHYSPSRRLPRGIFRTLINLDFPMRPCLGKGEVVCSIHTGSTTKTPINQSHLARVPVGRRVRNTSCTDRKQVQIPVLFPVLNSAGGKPPRSGRAIADMVDEFPGCQGCPR